MLRSTFCQLSFNEVDPDAIRLEDDAIERLLHDRVEDVATLDDFAGCYSEDQGDTSSDPMRLFVMLVLQYRYGCSDREVVRRARRDLGWRYAMRLSSEEAPPSRPVFQRFRAWVSKNRGEDFVHKRVLRLAQREHLLDDAALQAVDSTNTDCRGAVLDTFNLISRGIAKVVRKLSDWTGETVEALAERWGLDG